MKRNITRILVGVLIVVAALFGLMLPGPRLLYISVQPKDRYGNVSLKYELQNRSEWPIYYQGYGPEMPLYRLSYRSGNEWIQHPIMWCGTGAHFNRLGPWEKTFIYVHAGSVDTSRIFRVGIPYYRTTWMFPYELAADIRKGELRGSVWSKESD